jgi:hypothetical protein
MDKYLPRSGRVICFQIEHLPSECVV